VSCYRIEFTRRAERQFNKLPKDVQRRIAPAIEALADEPRPHGVKKLKADNAVYRIRVGDYRVIYEVRDNVLLVLVLEMGHRRDLYS